MPDKGTSTHRTTVYRHAELARLLHPASIAVIGASTRPGILAVDALIIPAAPTRPDITGNPNA